MVVAKLLRCPSASSRFRPALTLIIKCTNAPPVRFRFNASQNRYHFTRYSLVIMRSRCWNEE